MFATNPFSILAETVPSIVMQGFVVLMVLLIVAGTLLDIIHKKNVKYFFENAKKAKKNAPRTCDLDIIDFNNLVSKKNSKINLPHKMMHKRNFVLFPLFEIQKNWIHPDKQIDVKTLISLLPDRDIRSIKQI